MGRPFGVESERWHDRPSVVRRRARTGQSPAPRAADICPVGPRAAPGPARQVAVEQPGGCPFPGEGRVAFAGRPVETDISPAAWFADAGWIGPPVFPAYARVLHPAIRYVGDDDVEVSRAEGAAANAT